MQQCVLLSFGRCDFEARECNWLLMFQAILQEAPVHDAFYFYRCAVRTEAGLAEERV